MDDMSGANWTVFGVSGCGIGQFAQPERIALDLAGKVYVGDGGNARIVRMDNLTGANWVSLGTSGSGPNQFASVMALTLDSSGKIYAADTFNDRIVRMDDMLGTNWTVMGANLGSGGAQFLNPYGVGVDPFGTIYVADSRNYKLVQADDITGSALTTYGTAGNGMGQFDSPTSLLARPPASPVAVPRLSVTSLTFSDTVVGTPSPVQTVTMANVGSWPLTVNGIAAGGDFAQTDTCGSTLAAGQSCTITVTFTPTAGGRGPHRSH